MTTQTVTIQESDSAVTLVFPEGQAIQLLMKPGWGTPFVSINLPQPAVVMTWADRDLTPSSCALPARQHVRVVQRLDFAMWGATQEEQAAQQAGKLSLSALAALPPADRAAAIDTFIATRRSAVASRKILDGLIQAAEAHHSLSSEEMRTKYKAGQLPETHEILAWLSLLETRDTLSGKDSSDV
jgi:hypothetical protein